MSNNAAEEKKVSAPQAPSGRNIRRKPPSDGDLINRVQAILAEHGKEMSVEVSAAQQDPFLVGLITYLKNSGSLQIRVTVIDKR